MTTPNNSDNIFARRLVRSHTDRYIAGVCGGIAETYGINVTLVRLLFVIATLLGFSGVVLYVAAWILMPSA
ncbi:PspC domain-containing protein [Corynebacterium cystitidis]|uniref:PspC domain-containing protein n=1 Tax=Corynebacterium cystitidis TaxID=35757 RepID=UPI00211EC56E|nr:PspC domain-containing protein [Corynebacterium cystitidis]